MNTKKSVTTENDQNAPKRFRTLYFISFYISKGAPFTLTTRFLLTFAGKIIDPPPKSRRNHKKSKDEKNLIWWQNLIQICVFYCFHPWLLRQKNNKSALSFSLEPSIFSSFTSLLPHYKLICIGSALRTDHNKKRPSSLYGFPTTRSDREEAKKLLRPELRLFNDCFFRFFRGLFSVDGGSVLRGEEVLKEGCWYSNKSCPKSENIFCQVFL